MSRAFLAADLAAGFGVTRFHHTLKRLLAPWRSLFAAALGRPVGKSIRPLVFALDFTRLGDNLVVEAVKT